MLTTTETQANAAKLLERIGRPRKTIEDLHDEARELRKLAGNLLAFSQQLESRIADAREEEQERKQRLLAVLTKIESEYELWSTDRDLLRGIIAEVQG